MNTIMFNAIENKIEDVKLVLGILKNFDQIIFRGGTALSLSHNITKRFSEDIDISILKGKYSVKYIKDKVKIQIERLDWIEKIEEEKEKMYLYRKKAVTTSELFNGVGFDLQRILIEWPKKNVCRSENDVSYKNIEPFDQAGFTMKVMDVEHILADKALLIAKKFLYSSGGLDWMTKRTQGRHAYDLQRCLESGYNLKEEHLITLIKKEIIKSEEPFIRGDEPRPTNLINMIKRKDLFEAFKYEYSLKEEQIKTAIEQIVYPSHEKYSSSKMLRFYKKEFNGIVTLIKKEFSSAKSKK